MTTEQFLVSMQEYYGQRYTKTQAQYVKTYLDSKPDGWRERLHNVVLLRYTGLTPRGEKVLPNIAVFEGLAKEVRGK